MVLLILAGLTISYTMGNNSIFNKALDAKVQTELGKIEERANLIYTDRLMQNVLGGLSNKTTMEEIVEQLEKENYKIEQIEAGEKEITTVFLDKENIRLAFGKSNTIKVTVEESDVSVYYVLVNGKSYKMHYNDGSITVDRTPREVTQEGDGTTSKHELVAISGNETIAVATIDNNTKLITVTAKKEGTTTITVRTTTGTNNLATCIITVVPTLEGIIDVIQATNTIVEDENGNKIVIPGGFKVVPDTKDNDIKYTYLDSKIPCVQDGVVIQDEKGNQFVWVPIDEIKNKDGTSSTNTLGRYTFSGVNTLTSKLVQNADEWETPENIRGVQELIDSPYGNVTAKGLKDFIESSKKNGGYYFSRYETSKDGNGEVCSMYGKNAWKASQEVSAQALRIAFSNQYCESDLINSYCWDTTANFITMFHPSALSYKAGGFDKITGADYNDLFRNISDFSSNHAEWITATYSSTMTPCAAFGGYGTPNNTYEPLILTVQPTGKSQYYITSRILMYIKDDSPTN